MSGVAAFCAAVAVGVSSMSLSQGDLRVDRTPHPPTYGRRPNVWIRDGIQGSVFTKFRPTHRDSSGSVPPGGNGLPPRFHQRRGADPTTESLKEEPLSPAPARGPKPPRSESASYKAPLIALGAAGPAVRVSSGCTYEADTCALFQIGSRDSSFQIDVTDRSRDLVKIRVVQLIGARRLNVVSAEFCGGRSERIEILDDAREIGVEILAERCGGSASQGGQITATFMQDPE